MECPMRNLLAEAALHKRGHKSLGLSDAPFCIRLALVCPFARRIA